MKSATRKQLAACELLECRRLLTISGITVTYNGNVISDGATFNYGAFAQGATSPTNTLGVQNTGPDPVTLVNLGAAISPFGFILSNTNVDVEPNTSQSVTITPDTSQQGFFNAILQIEDNGTGDTFSVDLNNVVGPPNDVLPDRTIPSAIGASPVTDLGNVNIEPQIDGIGQYEQIDVNRALLFSLPAGQNTLTLSADPAFPGGDGSSPAMDIALIADANHDGKIELSESAAAIQTYTATAGQSSTFTATLPGGSYFLFLSPTATFLGGSGQSEELDGNLTLSATNIAPAAIAVKYNTTAITSGESSPASGNGTSFGSTTVGAGQIAHSFTVTNTGASPLTISSLSAPSGFDVNPGLPTTIAAGASATFGLDLLTGSAGSFSGNVSIVSNASNTPTFSFAVSGSVVTSFATLTGHTLSVAGTTGNDTIATSVSGSNLVATLNGVSSTFVLAQVSVVDISGNAGNDSITVGANVPSAVVAGGAGGDTIVAHNSAADTLLGQANGDSLTAGSGADLLNGGTGPDSLMAGAGNDTLHGNKGRDSLLGSTGNSYIVGGPGADTLLGISAGLTNPGADTLIGGAGPDSIVGGATDIVFRDSLDSGTGGVPG